MREILFRGFHPDENGKETVFVNGEWIKGTWVKGNHLYDDMTGKHYIVPFDNITESTKVGQDGCCYCVGFEVIPETVGQYTGSTDKNGTKILEGDMLMLSDDDADSTIYIVEWSDKYAGWALRQVSDKIPSLQMSDWVYLYEYREVVGNIYDNPELLEVKE